LIVVHQVVEGNMVVFGNTGRIVVNKNACGGVIRVVSICSAGDIVAVHLAIDGPGNGNARREVPEIWVVERIRRTHLIVHHSGTVDKRVAEGAEATVGDLVVIHVGTVRLHTEADAVVGDNVLCDCDVGLVIHANANEHQTQQLDRFLLAKYGYSLGCSLRLRGELLLGTAVQSACYIDPDLGVARAR